MKYKYRYVCAPNNISITAASSMHDSKGIKIKFLLGNKVVLELAHRLDTYTPTQDDISTHVARCCNFIKGSTEDYIQDAFDEGDIMGILNIHRFLKKVQTAGGTTIWKE